MKNQSEKTKKFYNETGWKVVGGITEDARLNEDLRACAKSYVSNCRKRVGDHLPKTGRALLDMASGPIQYPEYLEYSKNFEKRVCVDLSQLALDQAREKIGEKGEFYCADFLDLPLQENSFDCSISLHTIYHMHADEQEKAVRKLIHVTKVGAPIIIVYANPDYLLQTWINKIKRIVGKELNEKSEYSLYNQSHVLTWWDQFKNQAEVQIYPWRSLSSRHQKLFFLNNVIGKIMFYVLEKLENTFPNFFVRHFKYPMIVLTKKSYN